MLALSFVILAATPREACIELYAHRAPASARRYFNAFDSVFASVGAERNVEPALLKSIAWCETRLDPCAVSAAGAQGLMQFMPATFDAVARAADADDPFDPEHSIRSAGVYIAALLNYWQGNLEAVVASYNAGPNAVARALKRGRTVPAIAETQGYVACVLGAYGSFKTTHAATAPNNASILTRLFTALALGRFPMTAHRSRQPTHDRPMLEPISFVVQRVLAGARKEAMKKPRTLYVMRDYEAKGERKTARTPAGLLWEMDDGKVEFRVEVPGFAGGQLVAFRDINTDNNE